MKTYTADWQDKETAIIFNDEKPFGQVTFDASKWVLYGNALLLAGGETFRAELAQGNNVTILQGETEIFTAVFRPLWGNLELRLAGEDTGYDVKGKWFKAGTRLTDAEDNDMIIVTSDPWTGRQMEITVADAAVSDLMVVATIYFHIRASAAKTLGVIIGNM